MRVFARSRCLQALVPLRSSARVHGRRSSSVVGRLPSSVVFGRWSSSVVVVGVHRRRRASITGPRRSSSALFGFSTPATQEPLQDVVRERSCPAIGASVADIVSRRQTRLDGIRRRGRLDAPRSMQAMAGQKLAARPGLAEYGAIRSAASRHKSPGGESICGSGLYVSSFPCRPWEHPHHYAASTEVVVPPTPAAPSFLSHTALNTLWRCMATSVSRRHQQRIGLLGQSAVVQTRAKPTGKLS